MDDYEGMTMVQGKVVPRDTINDYDKYEYDRGAVRETRVMRESYNEFDD